MTAPVALAAHAAAFRYPSHARPVGPFDLEVHAGETLLVSGASGSGKSTLARLLCGAIPHLYRGDFDGCVRVAGRDTRQEPYWRLATDVGFVSQNPAQQLIAGSVRDEIVFGLESLGLPVREIEARTAAVLDEFELAPLAARDPCTLSGGEQQRLVLAAMLARRPRALVLDEPLSMLDTVAAGHLVTALERARAGGTTVVVCEHRLAPFAGMPGVRHGALPQHPVMPGAVPDLPPVAPPARWMGEDLTVRCGGRMVLASVSLEVRAGRVLALVGPNGAGKTTLLRVLAGLQPYEGRLVGCVTSRPPRLGLCFQNPDRQIFNATVREEILYEREAVDERFYRAVLDLLGLAPYEDTPPLLLSEGEKKRLGVAIALMSPGLGGLCLDEPTLGQDDHNRRLLGRVVRALAEAGYACVVATHDLDWALEWSDEMLLLAGGRVVASGPPVAVCADPAAWRRAGLVLPPPLAESACARR